MTFLKKLVFLYKIKKIMKKKILIGLAAVLILAQFIHPTKNDSNNNTNSIHNKYAANDETKQILKVACDDCHSNTTIYPWYANIQPIAAWIQHHVDDGKKHLNLSTLGAKPAYLQFHKMEEIEEMIVENEMPLASYTLIHRNADLSQAQKDAIVKWSREVRDSLKARFPADSLKMPARKK